MALDKQKILNELGNVVNQLQSADCGCMGKLFSNSNQGQGGSPMMNQPNDGFMQGCCHGHCHGCHGYNAPGAGEPYSRNGHCMGSCNPPKLYADTYNYLNQNLMQPAVNEVYNDLKSLTPDNTVINNPIAAQMGLMQGGNPNAGGAGSMGGGSNMMGQSRMLGGTMGNPNATSNMNHGPNAAQMNNPNNQQQMAHMGGAGPQIMNMINGDSGVRPKGMPNQGAPQSPNMPGSAMQGQYSTANISSNMGQGNLGAVQNPTTQYMFHQNPQGMPMAGNPAPINAQGNLMEGNMAQMISSGNPMPGNMVPTNSQPNSMSGNSMTMGRSQNPYGQHSAGVSKFKEMFPGVMKDDLGFDPMALAIQMNPSNQQKVAMNTMQKMMMSNNELNKVNTESVMKPVVNATNAAAVSVAQSNQQANGQIIPAVQPMQQFRPPVPNATAVSGQNQIPQQQVYTALTQEYQNSQRQMDPNTGVVNNRTLPTVYEGDSNIAQQNAPPTSTAPPAATGEKLIIDPIYPADTSKNSMPTSQMKAKYLQYNTLGQPVEMLPAHLYQSAIPDLPQTLSPQTVPCRTRTDPMKYSNVKPTMSKTSLMGVKSTPSTMQHLYNQYKGSQSFTQQNIRPSDNVASYSEGHLNVQQTNPARQAPVEKVAGDTNANNVAPVLVKDKLPTPDQVGDVPDANKLPPVEDKKPTSHSKLRNGLQDQTYTAYVAHAAWSFHGDTPAPYRYSTGFRHRYRM